VYFEKFETNNSGWDVAHDLIRPLWLQSVLVSDDQGVAQVAVDAFEKLTGQPVEQSTNQTK
jgi:hypothetical protein